MITSVGALLLHDLHIGVPSSVSSTEVTTSIPMSASLSSLVSLGVSWDATGLFSRLVAFPQGLVIRLSVPLLHYSVLQASVVCLPPPWRGTYYIWGYMHVPPIG